MSGLARTRTFRSGDSQAIRLPRGVAFGDEVELVIVRCGDVMTLDPAQSSVPDMIARLDAILASLPAVAIDAAAAGACATIVANAGHARRKRLDRVIAAQALTHRATLATMNAADFSNAVGLQLLAR